MIKEFAVISRKNRKKITKFASGGGDGAEIIYALRNSDNLSSKIANEFIKSGQNVRKYYQRRLPSDSSKDYYYMLRNTPNNETIIVEYGFADSNGDDVNQIKNNWKGLAEAVVRALASYLRVSYKPPADMASNYYVVKKGDTLYSIARMYGISVNDLKQANNLSNNNLMIGMSLVIPTEDNNMDNEEIYIVKAGDSLYKIAGMYGMTVNELNALDNLTSNNLSIGQRLRVVKDSPLGENVYVVQPGDTLYSIARKFGISVDALKQANNMTSNLLSIGETLNIPVPIQTNNRIHIVQGGDNLYSIARTYNTTVNEIMRLNNLVNSNLMIGQKLLV